MDKIKQSGQVFTPAHIVEQMLDLCGYHSESILEKHVIDNSCGNGAFLVAVAERYIQQHTEQYGRNNLEQHLRQYIHGIELEQVAYTDCLARLNALARKHGLNQVQWDIRNEDALCCAQYDGRMDFVVGNPPYVRVHNLTTSYNTVKQFSFAQSGMTDLYIAFFELGFRMLNAEGKLCYITPSSWLSSTAAEAMRQYIRTTRHLTALIDFGHYQPFEGITTYTCISLFSQAQQHNHVAYSTQHAFVEMLSYADFDIEGKFYFGERHTLQSLRQIRSTQTRLYAQVKNGFATLADKVFISDQQFSAFTIPMVKASTGKWHKGLFPYTPTGKPLPKEEIFAHADVAAYFTMHKASLLKQSTEEENPTWYLYGRTQALGDVSRKKYAVSSIINSPQSIKIIPAPEGCGVYGGLYILTDATLADLQAILQSTDFMHYVRLLGNYKSGGYYTFNSKDLEKYLNYKLSNYARTRHSVSPHQQRVSPSNLQLV